MSRAKFVKRNEWPERTVENLPDEMVRLALGSLYWKACPSCGKHQWMHRRPTFNDRHTCNECGDTFIV